MPNDALNHLVQSLMSSAPETTRLSPAEELNFRLWAAAHSIRDVDHPNSRYDYRGYWRNVVSQGRNETSINAQDQQLHYPDTYKQHGHPTFSVESQYSRGPWDGVTWLGDTPLPPLMPSHVKGR